MAEYVLCVDAQEDPYHSLREGAVYTVTRRFFRRRQPDKGKLYGFTLAEIAVPGRYHCFKAHRFRPLPPERLAPLRAHLQRTKEIA